MSVSDQYIDDCIPENAVEIAAYRRALETIIRDPDCDPVQIAHEAITPFTDWAPLQETEPANCCRDFEHCIVLCKTRRAFRASLNAMKMADEPNLIDDARRAIAAKGGEPLFSHRTWRAMLTAVMQYVQLYNELIYCVGNKYPGETRHQTAKRYLLRAETNTGSADSPSANNPS